MNLYGKFILLAFAAAASGLLLSILGITLLNADLYGRLSESHIFDAQDTEQARLILAIHRLVPDENAAEVTIQLSVPSQPQADLVGSDREWLEGGVNANAYSGSSEVSKSIRIDSMNRGNAPNLTAVSERFNVPTFPSLYGFPFDDVRIDVSTYIRKSNGVTPPYAFEIQKRLPGRRLSGKGNLTVASITLSRPSTERMMVLVSSIVFVSLVAMLAFYLFRRQSGSPLEEMLGVTSFLIGAAGFREIVGVTRSSGVSVLEIVVFGVPLLLLAYAIMAGALRRSRKTDA